MSNLALNPVLVPATDQSTPRVGRKSTAIAGSASPVFARIANREDIPPDHRKGYNGGPTVARTAPSHHLGGPVGQAKTSNASETGNDGCHAWDSDHDRPRPRSDRGDGSGHVGLVMGMSIGGGVLLLGVIALVIALAVKGGGNATGRAIIGVWQPLNQPNITRIQFTVDGKVHITVRDRSFNGTYRFLDDRTIEIEGPNDFGQTVGMKFTVSFTGEEMAITNPQLGTTVHYRRVQF